MAYIAEKNPPIILGALLLLFFLLSSFSLEADSPLELSWSTAPFTDEASKLNNVRNNILFGSSDISGISDYCSDCETVVPLEVDSILNWVVYAPYYFIFSQFGISYESARIVSVLFSILSLVLVYLLVSSIFNRNAGLLSVILLGFNYYFLMYSRLALLEIPLIFFSLLFLFLWYRGYTSNKSFYYALSIIALIVGFAFKPSLVFFFPVVFGAFAISHLAKHYTKKNLLIYTVLLLLFFASFFLLLSPGFLELLINYASVRSPSSPIQLFQNFTVYIINWLFRNILPLVIVSFAAAFWTLFSYFRNPKDVNPLVMLATIWLIAGSFILSLQSYQPPRYSIMLLPAMVILAVFLIREFYSNGIRISSVNNANIHQKGIIGIFALLFLFSFSVYLNKFIITWHSLEARAFSIFITFGILVILSLILILIFRKRLYYGGINYPSSTTVWFSVIILLFLLVPGLFQYYGWSNAPKYSLIDASKHLESNFPDAIVLGTWSDALCFPTELKCYAGADGTNYEHIFHELQITHLLNMQGETQDRVLNNYLAYESIQLNKITTYNIGKFKVDLYEVNLKDLEK